MRDAQRTTNGTWKVESYTGGLLYLLEQQLTLYGGPKRGYEGNFKRGCAVNEETGRGFYAVNVRRSDLPVTTTE